MSIQIIIIKHETGLDLVILVNLAGNVKLYLKGVHLCPVPSTSSQSPKLVIASHIHITLARISIRRFIHSYAAEFFYDIVFRFFVLIRIIEFTVCNHAAGCFKQCLNICQSDAIVSPGAQHMIQCYPHHPSENIYRHYGKIIKDRS